MADGIGNEETIPEIPKNLKMRFQQRTISCSSDETATSATTITSTASTSDSSAVANSNFCLITITDRYYSLFIRYVNNPIGSDYGRLIDELIIWMY